jgi:hypothetical protein
LVSDEKKNNKKEFKKRRGRGSFTKIKTGFLSFTVVDDPIQVDEFNIYAAIVCEWTVDDDDAEKNVRLIRGMNLH